jgi:chromate transporter
MNEQASLGQRRGLKPSLGDLVCTFNQIALASFGGGLSAWSREVIVVEKQWMGDHVPDPSGR